jgi:hypothetical protein
MANYNLITGKIGALQSVALTDEEQKAFDASFATLVAKKNAIDPEIGKSFDDQHDFYAYAAQVAKAYFSTSNIPFVPDEPTSGAFGMREMLPQDVIPPSFAGAPPSVVSGFSSWKQLLTLGAANIWTNLFGPAGVPGQASNVQSYHSLLAFHGLISWQASSRALLLRHLVNGYQYPAVSVEQDAKIDKKGKNFKLIPLEGDFLIHPTGYWTTDIALEKEVVGNIESYTEQIGILGLTFAEYSYLLAKII